MWKYTEFRVKPGFFLILFLSAYMGQGRVLFALLSAALCHEAAHLMVLWFFHIPVDRITLTARGAEIEAPMQTKLSYGREIIAVAAGPTSNILLAVLTARLAGWYLFAGASLILGIYNLLPVERLDGGRILHLLISWIWEPFTADRICLAVSIATAWCVILLTAGLLIASGQGVLLVVGAAGLLIPEGMRKRVTDN